MDDRPTESGSMHNAFDLIALLRALPSEPVMDDTCIDDLAAELEIMTGGVLAADILLCAQREYTAANIHQAVQLAKARTRDETDRDSMTELEKGINLTTTDTRKGGRSTNRAKKTKCCRHWPIAWFKKYFWEGQELQKPLPENLKQHLSTLPWHKRLLMKHRRLLGFAIPGIVMQFLWWSCFISHNLWGLFVDKYPMTITMIVGSIIAGMTSEGGGAVAFPVMTLALNVKPTIARDFSIMIQSVGMTSAAFTIFFMRVRIEWHSIVCCSLGGLGGLIFGLHVIDPVMSAPVKKLGFVSIWFAFASVLIFLNRTSKRQTFNKIPNCNWWKILVLLIFGFIGGIFTSFSGNGLDICSFMVLTLLFRISEKIATPTSVILMAINSVVGIYWRAAVMTEPISDTAWEYMAVCVPVVVMGAPVGSMLGSHFHRLVLAGLVILLDTIALVGAFAIIRPLPMPLVGGCVAVIIFCFGLFMAFTYAGQKLLDGIEANQNNRKGVECSEPECSKKMENGEVREGISGKGNRAVSSTSSDARDSLLDIDL